MKVSTTTATTKKKPLNLEKYRRRQDRISAKLLEMVGRSPFDPQPIQPSRILPRTAKTRKQCKLVDRLKRKP